VVIGLRPIHPNRLGLGMTEGIVGGCVEFRRSRTPHFLLVRLLLVSSVS
jgi:hypothetical protein